MTETEDALIYFLWALLVGAVITVQSGLNSVLGIRVGNPYLSTWCNFATGFAAVTLANLMIGSSIPSRAQLAAIPWYYYIGGFMGFFVVISFILLIPKVGFVKVVMAAIFAQIVVSSLLDHFGVFGQALPLTLTRFLGMLLMLAGVGLVNWR